MNKYNLPFEMDTDGSTPQYDARRKSKSKFKRRNKDKSLSAKRGNRRRD